MWNICTWLEDQHNGKHRQIIPNMAWTKKPFGNSPVEIDILNRLEIEPWNICWEAGSWVVSAVWILAYRKFSTKCRNYQKWQCTEKKMERNFCCWNQAQSKEFISPDARKRIEKKKNRHQNGTGSYMLEKEDQKPYKFGQHENLKDLYQCTVCVSIIKLMVTYSENDERLFLI